MSSSHPTILVFGATGHIGSEVAAALAKKKVSFRAVVHNVNKADGIKKLGSNIEVVEADIYKPETVAKALQGIEKVFMMTPPAQTVVPGKMMADAMAAAKVKHVVKLSAMGVEAGDKFKWAAEHLAVEEYIKSKGIPLTSFRPSSFCSNNLADIPTIKEKQMIFKALGDAKLNYISNSDIGEAAAVCLTTSGHEGKAYVLTGPTLASGNEVASLFSDALGKKITYVPMSDEELRKVAVTFLPNAELVNGFSNMWAYFRSGSYNSETGDVEKLLGRKGETLKSWITRNIHLFK